jgi:glycosyltransferase involved in cell wall biosynthesis
MIAPLRILHIAAVGPFGGASRSLYEAMAAFPDGAVERYFLMQKGTALNFYGRLAKDSIATSGLTRLDHTRLGYYRGVRWIVPLRELGYFPGTLRALFEARKRWSNIDVIHLNEITDLIPGLIAKALFRKPMVVHVRTLQQDEPKSFRTRWVQRQLRRHADAVVAIDESVRATLPRDLAVDVIHNSFSPQPAGDPDVAYLAQLDTLRPDSLKVGFVGNLHRFKGLRELFEAAKIVKAEGRNVQFLIVGGTTAVDKGLKFWLLNKLGLAQNMQAEMHEAVAAEGLADDFRLLGPTPDIQRVYQQMDVLAFPSYHDAPGRPVFEAAFFGVPSIVAVRNPLDDTVRDGETAIAVPTPDPRLLADAVAHFESDRSEVKRMGENARALAQQNFRPEVNAKLLLDLFRRVAGRGSPPAALAGS